MSTSNVRPARPSDLSGVLALYRQLNPSDPLLDNSLAESTWTALLSCGFTTVFVAELREVLVSTCTLAIVPNLSRGARPYGVIENVVTDAGHRRMGLGRSILDAACQMAWDSNCYKILLATGSQNEKTLSFYQNSGFRRNAKTYFEKRRP